MKTLEELIDEYRSQGHDYYEARRRAKQYLYHHKRYNEQRLILEAIELMKVHEPKKYAELMYEATHVEEIAAKRREEEGQRREERLRLEELRLFKFRHSLVTAGVPNIDFSGIEGMIAFRTWNVKQQALYFHAQTGERMGDLFLGSTAMASVWKSQMIADRIPTNDNVHGLYCAKLDPLGLMTRVSYYLGDVCGLLELRGRILEHTDGVVRAEWARIICVFIQANEKTEGIYGSLLQSYPTVPIHVLHKEQIAEVLLRVTVMQSMMK